MIDKSKEVGQQKHTKFSFTQLSLERIQGSEEWINLRRKWMNLSKWANVCTKEFEIRKIQEFEFEFFSKK